MAQTNPYLVLGNKWHMVDSEDTTKLVCGITKPLRSESGMLSTKVCKECKPAFPIV